MFKTSFNPDAKFILTMTGCIAVALAPFSIIRFLRGDFVIASLNSISVLITAFAFFYVLFTNKTKFAKYSLASVCILLLISSISIKGWQQVIWAFPTYAMLFAVFAPKIAAISVTIIILLIGMIIFGQVANLYIFGFIISSGATSVFLYAFTAKMHFQSSILQDMVDTDPLTGVLNRRALDAQLQHIFQSLANKEISSCSLIMLDIDHFKQVNDEYGHDVGDILLKEFSHAIKTHIRQDDRFYRIGGEEFVVLLMETNSDTAMEIAEDLRKQIENSDWTDPRLNITISLGVAEFKDSQSMNEWFKQADNAMYSAKQGGRNKAVRA